MASNESVSFRFAPDILRRLGEELNPSFDQGVLELVKNAHDADATVCTVELMSSDRPGGTLTVEDDGDGMTRPEIANGWLVLGRSAKSVRDRTRLGRIPAGNKGLGRLAALRLGQSVVLRTRPRRGRTAYEVGISWPRFQRASTVEDVAIPIRQVPSTAAHGTTVTVSDLRSRISRTEVKRLARAMILLADPFGDDPNGFKPVLKAPEYADLEKLVDERYFKDADYHLVAQVRGGMATARVVDWKGDELYQAAHDDIATDRAGGRYRVPDAQFDLWAFILNRTTFASRAVSLAEVRSWIEAFGGVHVYLNGLRVAPYGNPGNDWLDMNLRRVQNPEERPSTNTAIGRVSLEDTRELLVQKTDRSGFIETETFEELRLFAQACLDWMARVRLQTAEVRRARERKVAPTRSQRTRKSLAQQIETVPKSVRAELQTALDRYDRARQRETDALRREVQLYRTLSTAGITAATFAHESAGSPLKVIGQSINAVEFRARRELGPKYSSTLAKPVDSIKRASDALGVLSSATLRLVDADKRRVGRVDLDDIVSQLLTTFGPFFAERDVDLRVGLKASGAYLRGTQAALESIVANLTNNSLAAFEANVDEPRVLSVSTDVEGQTWRLIVSDTGPGVQSIDFRAIWLPGETRRPNGTGLGLTIVRDAVADLGGSAEVRSPGVLGGADFVVELPILGIGG